MRRALLLLLSLHLGCSGSDASESSGDGTDATSDVLDEASADSTVDSTTDTGTDDTAADSSTSDTGATSDVADASDSAADSALDAPAETATDTGPAMPSGTLDTTFGMSSTGSNCRTIFKGSTTLTGSAHAVGVQPSNKIIVVGEGDQISVARFDASGLFDTTFGSYGLISVTPSGANASPRALYMLPDGKMLIAGFASILSDGGSSNPRPLITRLTAEGVVDTTFGTAGFTIDSTLDDSIAYAITVASGSIWVAGEYVRPTVGGVRAFIRRYSLDGTPGAAATIMSFGSGDYDTKVRNIFTDGTSVFVSGTVYAPTEMEWAVAKFGTSGPDGAFGTSGVSRFTAPDPSYAGGLVQQSTGDFMMAGYVDAGAKGSRVGFMRLSSAGVKDATFGTKSLDSALPVEDAMNALLLMSGDRILVGTRHDLTTGNAFGLEMVKKDGTLDPTFGTGGIVSTAVASEGSYVTGLARQSDGKIIAAGTGTGGGHGAFCVARYWP